MALLSDEEISAALNRLTGWQRDGAAIVRTVAAPDFISGVELVAAVARTAEEADHHPDVDIRYTRLRFALTSHDSGGVTRRDVDMAGRIDTLVAQAWPQRP